MTTAAPTYAHPIIKELGHLLADLKPKPLYWGLEGEGSSPIRGWKFGDDLTVVYHDPARFSMKPGHVLVKPGWGTARRHLRTVTYVKPEAATIAAKVREMLGKIAEAEKNAEEARTAAVAHRDRVAAASAKVKAAIAARPDAGDYINRKVSNWRAAETGGCNGEPYGYRFTLELENLTEDEALAVLAVLGPSR